LKPGDHPEFFRFPAPEGRSRESTIVLDAEGHFSHDGERVTHMKLEQAMHTWVSRHPDDGRFILTNGYDWTYFTVDDAPFFVRHLERNDAGLVVMVLSDGTRETLDPDDIVEGENGALYVTVKKGSTHGPFEAKLTRHAQASLGDFLVPDETGAPTLPAAPGIPPEAGPQNTRTDGVQRRRFSPKSRDKSPKK
jgi:hypothetical protein